MAKVVFTMLYSCSGLYDVLKKKIIKILPLISSLFQNVPGIWGFYDKLVCGALTFDRNFAKTDNIKSIP